MYIAGLERCEKKKPREKGANKYQKSRRIFGEEKKSIQTKHFQKQNKKKGGIKGRCRLNMLMFLKVMIY
jgi:hypothetical protein